MTVIQANVLLLRLQSEGNKKKNLVKYCTDSEQYFSFAKEYLYKFFSLKRCIEASLGVYFGRGLLTYSHLK